MQFCFHLNWTVMSFKAKVMLLAFALAFILQLSHVSYSSYVFTKNKFRFFTNLLIGSSNTSFKILSNLLEFFLRFLLALSIRINGWFGIFCIFWFSNKNLFWGNQNKQQIGGKNWGIRENKICETIWWAHHLDHFGTSFTIVVCLFVFVLSKTNLID